MSIKQPLYQQGKVSIIIPMYNRASLLPETLDSILAQTYANWECILVDDGSTDETINVARSYACRDSRFRVYSRPSNVRKGANACRNYGFSLSDGEFIQWFDSDDLMNSSLLQSTLDVFETDTDFVIFGSGEFSGHWSGEITPKSIINDLNQNSVYSILVGDSWFGTPQAIFRKKYFNQKELFDLTLQRNQETEFFIRILLSKPTIKFKVEVLVYIRKHDNSITGFYQDISNEKKLLCDFPAYRKIYLNCKKVNSINTQLENLFKDFFFRCLRKMPEDNMSYFYLFLMGSIHNLFPSLIVAFRIFISRIVRKVYRQYLVRDTTTNLIL
jgi:glycosyltransferase involved in cell wall biosynthesis